MSPTYTKLFNSILDSTVWQEDETTRLLWITLMAMSDKDGEIHAAIPGLAHRARISVDQAVIGLKKFMDPDPYSRTPDFEGRRLEVIDGGWKLLNHAKYRKLLSYDERKEYNRTKQAEWRAKNLPKKEQSGLTTAENHDNVKEMSNNVKESQSQHTEQRAKSAHTDTKAKADTDTKAIPPVGGSLPDTASAKKLKEKNKKEKRSIVEEIGFNPTAIWCEEYKKRFRINPVVDSRGGKTLNEISRQLDSELHFRKIAERYFKCPLPFYANAGHPISMFSGSINRWKSEVGNCYAESQPERQIEYASGDEESLEDVLKRASAQSGGGKVDTRIGDSGLEGRENSNGTCHE